MNNYKFHYKNLQEVKETLNELKTYLPLSKKISLLKEPLKLGKKDLSNRMGIAPMEGADSNPDGSPSLLTTKRYIDLAKGGASLIWFEAIAVTEEGRSSPKQLMLTDKTLDSFKKLIENIKEEGMKKNGYFPYLIMQANHSGRYAKPDGTPHPIIAYHHPIYEKNNALSNSAIATDDYLKGLESKFGEGAKLAKEAGFDAYDVKSCHGYLFAELASGYTRPGEYGGSFDNRFRLLFNSIQSAKEYQDDNFTITSRVGIYDGFPFPYGFGVSQDSGIIPDYAEPLKLIDYLNKVLHIDFINITMGNPYQNTHVTRPYDLGNYAPPEHPLIGVSRIYTGTKYIKDHCKNMVIMSSAPSYLRTFSPNLAAGAIEEKYCDLVCFGRMSFACPDFPNLIKIHDKIPDNKTCVTCGRCGVLIRGGQNTGCVVRYPDPYLNILKEYLNNK